MIPLPIGDEKVQTAMKGYRDRYGKEFPIDFIDVEIFAPEDAVAVIEDIIRRGEPVRADELINTEKIYGEKVDLSEYL